MREKNRWWMFVGVWLGGSLIGMGVIGLKFGDFGFLTWLDFLLGFLLTVNGLLQFRDADFGNEVVVRVDD